MTLPETPMRSAVPWLHLPEGEAPYLAGSRCDSCGTVYVGTRAVCAKCFARQGVEPVRLSDHGRLWSYTIVHRSYPGVKVPFVAAVIDLEGGGTVNATLTDVTADPACLPYDLPVRLSVRDTGQRDADGRAWMAPFFVPANPKPAGDAS